MIFLFGATYLRQSVNNKLKPWSAICTHCVCVAVSQCFALQPRARAWPSSQCCQILDTSIDILVNSWALRVVSLINLVNYMPHVRKHLGIIASRSNLTFRFFFKVKITNFPLSYRLRLLGCYLSCASIQLCIKIISVAICLRYSYMLTWL